MIVDRTRCLKVATFAAVFGLWCGSALADPLISDAEAQRPNDVSASPSRSITRGPTIRFDAPRAGIQPHKPFDFRIHFDPHGGATVDLASVKVIYLKSPSVDLTPRLKPYISQEGVDMSQAEIPAGVHNLKVELQDSEGHSSEAVLTLSASQ